MKKSILILLLAGLSTVLQACPITPEKALKVAERVLSAQSATKAASPLRIIWDGETATTKADAEAPAFYVVGRDGGGFVIVAGNDNVRPVLALSYTNRFQVEGMPCNVSAWMERIKSYSRTVQEATPEVKAQWETFEETKSGRFPDAGVTDVFFPQNTPTVEWNQSEPANLLMPTVPGDSERSVCGCVPLAIAEIMTWFGYPEKGTGTVERYVTNQGYSNAKTIPAHDLGREYDWAGLQSLKTDEQFRAQCSNGDTTDLAWDAAHLLYDVGTLIQVNYRSSGTGGNEDRIPSQFSEHMGYSKNVVKRGREYGYPAWKWDQMLVEQVKVHPVYYGGYEAKGGGHAYVLDGYGYYGGDVVFHFNFGWSGYCNGYYSSDYQAPEDGRRPNTDFGEYSTVDALFDFVPDPNNQTSFVYELSYSEDGLGITGSGNNRFVYADELCNSGNVAFSGMVSLFHLDKNGQRDSEPLESKNINSFSAFAYYNNYRIALNGTSSSLALGDKYAFYYRPTGGEYKQVKGHTASSAVAEVPVYPMAFIETAASYSKNDYFYFRLTNQDFTYTNAVWTITDKDGVVTTCYQSADCFKLTKTGKYTIKVTPVQGGETIVTVINVN